MPRFWLVRSATLYCITFELQRPGPFFLENVNDVINKTVPMYQVSGKGRTKKWITRMIGRVKGVKVKGCQSIPFHPNVKGAWKTYRQSMTKSLQKRFPLLKHD